MILCANIFRIIILIIGIIVITINVRLYIFCKQQKAESQINSNKFKYQQDQIERIGKDLEDVRQQIKDQKDTGKNIQTSLVDFKAEADATKQDMKIWQKDYVSVLAGLEKKMDDSQDEIKSLESNLVALNIPELKKNLNTLEADLEKVTSAPEKKIERNHLESQ
jgi:predicted  nucleic acid-binding Zn-ribbon protein